MRTDLFYHADGFAEVGGLAWLMMTGGVVTAAVGNVKAMAAATPAVRGRRWASLYLSTLEPLPGISALQVFFITISIFSVRGVTTPSAVWSLRFFFITFALPWPSPCASLLLPAPARPPKPPVLGLLGLL